MFPFLLEKGNNSEPREQHSNLEKHLHGNALLGTLFPLWPVLDIFPRLFRQRGNDDFVICALQSQQGEHCLDMLLNCL